MAPRALGMDAFEIDTQWIDADSDGIRPEFDQTYGSLGIRLDGKWATSFATQSGVRGERLEVPSYSIAEWMAENWWALLFEPKKTDIAEADLGFRSRHWVGTARDGRAMDSCSLTFGFTRLAAEPSTSRLSQPHSCMRVLSS